MPYNFGSPIGLSLSRIGQTARQRAWRAGASLFLFGTILCAQVPHEIPHMEGHESPGDHFTGKETPEEREDREGLEKLRASQRPMILPPGTRLFTGEEQTLQLGLESQDPVQAAQTLQGAYRARNYRSKNFAEPVDILRKRYGAESDAQRRQNLKSTIKLAEYANWDFQTAVNSGGQVQTWLAIKEHPQPPAPPDVLRNPKYAVYLEDHSSLAGVDAGAQVIAAATMAVSQGKLKAVMLRSPVAAAAFTDFIYDQSTSRTFRRITKDNFDPDKGPETPGCDPRSLSNACDVVLLTQ